MRSMFVFSIPAGVLAALAACAVTTAESDPNGPPATIDVPDAIAPSDAVADAGSELDAACDPSDPNCVTKPISCAEAAWCPVATGVSSLYVLTSVWGKAPNDVWAAGSGGTIVHWDGTTWTAGNIPVKNTFGNLLGVGADVWALSATDTMYRTSAFAGAATQWELVPSPLDEYSIVPITAAFASPNGELRLGCPTFNVFDSEGNFSSANQLTTSTADGGVAWKGWPGTATVNALWGVSADDVWLAGDNSTWVKWQLGLTLHGRRASGGDAGADLEWKEIDSQASVILFSIWGSSANDVWTVGDKGTIRHVANANAERWDVVASPTKEPLRSVFGFAPDDVWAVGDNGTIIHWDGKEWKDSVAAFQVNKKKPDLHAVWGSGPNDVWIVGDGVALHHTGANQ